MPTNQIVWSNLFKQGVFHLLFWVFIVFYFAWGFGFRDNPKLSFFNAIFYLPGYFLIVYSLIYFLVPNYLLKRLYLKFFVGLFLVLVLCVLYSRIAQLTLLTNENFQTFDISTGRAILPFFHVAGFAVSIKLLGHWYEQKQQTIEAEQQRTVAELQLLKSQLHPHFLFNTLNNLYSLTLEQSPKAPEIVLKLSSVLRFMIYESNHPKISLQKEVQLLQHYIALEELRYGDRLDFSLVIDGDIDIYEIAPLLLLPFLENAFKHGISKQIDLCWISFYLSIKDDSMNFKLINSLDKDQEHETKAIMGGLGLENIKRRLQLLYSEKHQLETLMLDDVYIVMLDLKLDPIRVRPKSSQYKYANQIQY